MLESPTPSDIVFEHMAEGIIAKSRKKSSTQGYLNKTMKQVKSTTAKSLSRIQAAKPVTAKKKKKAKRLPRADSTTAAGPENSPPRCKIVNDSSARFALRDSPGLTLQLTPV